MVLEVLRREGGQNCQVFLPSLLLVGGGAHRSYLTLNPQGCSLPPLLSVILWDPRRYGQGIRATVPWQEDLPAVWPQSLLLQGAQSLA